jgi:predicted peroxiredoxin
MTALAVLLLHSTDEPEVAVAALRAARAAAARPGARRPVLRLDAEGVRLAARGVAEALTGGGRPDCKALLDGFVAAGGRLQVARDAWTDRGYLDDALVPGAEMTGPEGLADLAREGHAFVSF